MIDIRKMLLDENSPIIAVVFGRTIYTKFGVAHTGCYDHIYKNADNAPVPCLILQGAYDDYNIIPIEAIMKGKLLPDNQTIEFGDYKIKFLAYTTVSLTGG